MKLTKKQQKELQQLADDISKEAELVVEDFTTNPSENSGSLLQVHINSDILDEE